MLTRVLLVILAAASLDAQVTFDRILRADKEPQNWLTYSGSTAGQRYSALTQINAENAKNLTMQWAFQARSTEKFEATPLVVDGTMYLTQAPNDVVALDAATGEIKWLYSYSPSREARPWSRVYLPRHYPRQHWVQARQMEHLQKPDRPAA